MSLWLLLIQDPTESLNINQNLTILPFNSFENALTSFRTILQNMIQNNEIFPANADQIYQTMRSDYHAYYADLQFEIRAV